MARNIITGIDIGTYQVKVVVTELFKENGKNIPRIFEPVLLSQKVFAMAILSTPTTLLKVLLSLSLRQKDSEHSYQTRVHFCRRCRTLLE